MTTADPESNSALEELRERVQQALAKVRETVPSQFHRDALIELLRTLDWVQLSAMTSGEWPDMWLTRVRYGMVRAISLFLPHAENSQDRRDSASSEERDRWATSQLLRCGTLTLIALQSDYVASGLLSIRKSGANRYYMRVIHPDSGVEAVERMDLNWWSRTIASKQGQEEAELLKQDPDILMRLATVLHKEASEYEDQNDDDDVIDTYFETRAVISAERMHGYDYFPNDAKLGGIIYLTYKSALIVLMRWALYEWYRLRVRLDLASISFDSVAARELFAPVVQRDEIVDLFTETLNVSREAASTITRMFTLDAQFAMKGYANVPNAAVPPLIALSHDDVALSLHGCLNAPFDIPCYGRSGPVARRSSRHYP